MQRGARIIVGGAAIAYWLACAAFSIFALMLAAHYAPAPAQNVGPTPTGSAGSSGGQTIASKGAHIIWGGGAAPTVSGCGTGPTIEGTDAAFTVTPGPSQAGCTVTFAVPFAARPTCVLAGENVLTSYTVTANAVTITSTTGGDRIHVHCVAHGGGG